MFGVEESPSRLHWVTPAASFTLFVSGVALFVLMCSGAARAPLPHMAKLTVGFSASALLCEGISLYSANALTSELLSNEALSSLFADQSELISNSLGGPARTMKISMIISVILLTLGIFQLLGKLDGYQTGCGMLITSFAGGFILKSGSYIYTCCTTGRALQESISRQLAAAQNLHEDLLDTN